MNATSRNDLVGCLCGLSESHGPFCFQTFLLKP